MSGKAMKKKATNKDAARREPHRSADDASAAVRLEDRTRTDLFELAQRLEIAGYADMSKAELVEAIRRR